VIQNPVNPRHVSAIPREEKKRWQIGRTWSGDKAHLHTIETMYPTAHDNVQCGVDCKRNEGEKCRDESEERRKHG
jgi:hypothetical protein